MKRRALFVAALAVLAAWSVAEAPVSQAQFFPEECRRLRGEERRDCVRRLGEQEAGEQTTQQPSQPAQQPPATQPQAPRTRPVVPPPPTATTTQPTTQPQQPTTQPTQPARQTAVWARSRSSFTRFNQLNASDLTLYTSREWAEAQDPEARRARYLLTCLSTVYAIIEHARGNRGYRVGPDTYSDYGGGAIAIAGASQTESRISLDTLRSQFSAGNPVILKGSSSSIPQHFLLAIGIDENGRVIALDPLGGREVEIDPSTWAVSGSQARNFSVTHTRRVDFSARSPTPTTTTASVPSTPTNARPGEASGPGPSFAGSSVTVQWNAVSGATYYDVGVRDIDANAMVIDQQVRDATSVRVPLTAGRRYRWNVAACNSAGCSRYTSLLYFSAANAQTTTPQTTTPTTPTAPPSTPTGASPGDSSGPGPSYTGSSVDIRWNAVSGATYYEVGVRDIDANTMVIDQQVRGATSLRVPITAGRRYRWNVAACNSAGCSRYTSLLYFNAAAASTASVPSTPTGASPGQSTSPGPVQGSRSVRLQWGAVSGADYYELGVRDVASGELVVDVQVNGTSRTVSLTAGRSYRWNVAACNRSGCSRYTGALYFRTP